MSLDFISEVKSRQSTRADGSVHTAKRKRKREKKRNSITKKSADGAAQRGNSSSVFDFLNANANITGSHSSSHRSIPGGDNNAFDVEDKSSRSSSSSSSCGATKKNESLGLLSLGAGEENLQQRMVRSWIFLSNGCCLCFGSASSTSRLVLMMNLMVLGPIKRGHKSKQRA